MVQTCYYKPEEKRIEALILNDGEEPVCRICWEWA